MSALFDRVIIASLITPGSIVDHARLAMRGKTIAVLSKGRCPPLFNRFTDARA